MKKEFIASFQLSKKIVFNVNYYTLGNNSSPYFSTSADEFNQPKTDYCRGGQAQEDLTKNFLAAKRFWKKWDKKHLQDLTEKEYGELMQDIETLKEKYNYIYKELDESLKPYNPNIRFYDLKKLSMLKLPNTKNKAQKMEAK